MRKTLLYILSPLCFFIFFSFLSSCETKHYFVLETQQPAAITFPIVSPNIVIVNNAVIQPANSGIDYWAGNKYLSGHTLSKDSIHYYFIDLLAQYLDETHFFNDVLIYNNPLREDGSFLSSQPIPLDTILKITGNVQADVLISVDNLLFNISQILIGNEYIYSSIKTNGKVSLSIYFPGQQAESSFVLTDSIKFGDFLNNDTTLMFKKIPEQLLREIAVNLSRKAVNHFVPYWSHSERVIYTGTDSEMKSAFAYAKKTHWDKASEIWENIFIYDKNNKRKGMSAMNIALSEEMKDQYTTALEWVKKAIDCYEKEKPASITEEYDFAMNYKKILERRIKNNSSLDLQLHKRENLIP